MHAQGANRYLAAIIDGVSNPRAEVPKLGYTDRHVRPHRPPVGHAINVHGFIARVAACDCAVKSYNNMMPCVDSRRVSCRWAWHVGIRARSERVVAAPMPATQSSDDDVCSTM